MQIFENKFKKIKCKIMKTIFILFLSLVVCNNVNSQDPCYDQWVTNANQCTTSKNQSIANANQAYQNEVSAAQTQFDQTNDACYQAWLAAKDLCGWGDFECVLIAWSYYVGCTTGASAVKEGQIYAAKLTQSNSLNDAETQFKTCNANAKAVRDQCYKDHRPTERISNMSEFIIAEPRIKSVYPNPSNGVFSVDYSGNSAGKAQLRVYDMAGRIFYSDTKAVKSGMNHFNLQLNIPDGIYLVEVKDGAVSSHLKIVIDRNK